GPAAALKPRTARTLSSEDRLNENPPYCGARAHHRGKRAHDRPPGPATRERFSQVEVVRTENQITDHIGSLAKGSRSRRGRRYCAWREAQCRPGAVSGTSQTPS